MNNSEHNQKTISDRARIGIAIGAAFTGILIAGLAENPAIALSGTAQQEEDARSGPGIGLGNAGGSQAGPDSQTGSGGKGSSGAKAVDPELQPAVWYNEDGLWLYSPQEDRSVQITSYAEGGAPDRMTEVYSETNPADDVVLSQDKTLAAYCRNQTMSIFSGTTSELWCTELSADRHRERKLGENVILFKILPDNSIVWIDADSGFYRQQDPMAEEKPARTKLGSGVTDFRMSADGKELFYITDLGTGYALSTEAGAEPRRIAESVYGIEWASEDLNTIYYTNGETDLFCISNLRDIRIVDVDIADFVVMENTGHVYYLRADEGDAGAAAEGTESGAGETVIGTDDAELELTEEQIMELINSITLDNGQTIAEAAESAAAEKEGESGEEDSGEEDGETGEGSGSEKTGSEKTGGKASGKEASEAETADASGPVETVLPESRTGRMGYFDGQNHGVILTGVGHLNMLNTESMEQDRLLVQLDLDNDYRIFMLRDDVPLDTGLKLTDEGLTDLCIDFARDTLYYVRQSGDEIGTMDRGTVYARDFDEKGFGKERKLFDGATVISAARDGRVYTGAFPDSESGSRFVLDGKIVSEHVSSFWWDENGVSDVIRIYRNVFQDNYYVSGEFCETTEDGSLRGIAYNVRECHAFIDGSYTFLTDYDEERRKGTLLYWDGESDHKPVVVSRDASGTKKGTYE